MLSDANVISPDCVSRHPATFTKGARMSSTDHAIRAAFLCCHFARNLAYYNAARKELALDKEGFWLTVTGNFVDVCALEWCKLFWDRGSKYHWQNIFKEPNGFKQDILKTHGLDETGLKKLCNEMKDYRNKFVAHLEEKDSTKVPCMSTPYLLVCFYYRRMQCDFQELQSIEALPKFMDRYFDTHLREAEGIFRLCK